MELGEYRSVLNFLFSDKQANIKRKGNKEYKKVIINDVEYPYNKEKPLVKKTKNKTGTSFTISSIQTLQNP